MTLQEPGDLGYNDFHVSLFYLAIIDFENISDANVTIALKNLAKKNAVTKEKRLNEFLRMLENSSFDVKDYHILVCWLQLYPRLAIDSQRTVRHLAHQILATYMRLYGVKEFSRYLRTAMPIWLQGLFDDKAIANSVKGELLKSFSNDEAKVNVKIWVVFHEQIINYCHAVLVHESAASITDERSESAEEVSMKYDRAVNSALAMLMQIIRLANSEEYFISESASVQINEILTSEQFWGNLGQCASKDNFNTALLRSFLALISEMFCLDAGAPKQFTARLKETKSIYKSVSKNIIRNVKIAPASDTTSTVMYSTIIIPLMNVLTLLTNFTKQSTIKIKKNFWQYGGSKSFSRLKDILKLGPCNSAPNYYNSLYELLAAVETSGVQAADNFAFLEFSSHKDAENILQKILLPQILNLKGYNAFSFKYAGIQCVSHVFQLFERHIPHSPELAVLAQTVFWSLLDCISIARMTREDLRVKSLCITSLAQFYNTQLISQHAEMNDAVLALLEDGSNKSLNKVDISNDLVQVCTNFYFIMREISHEKSDAFLRASLESLESSYEPETISQGFTIMFNILSHIKENDILEQWMVMNLAGFVSKEFVELPLKILSKILQAGGIDSNLDSNLNLGQLFNDLFLKISDECPKYIPQLLGMIRQTTAFDGESLEVAMPDAYLHLLSISKDVKRSDSENTLIFEFVAETEILSNLLHSTVDPGRQTKLITSLAAHTQIIDLSAFDSAALKPLVLCALDFSVQDSSAKFLVSHVAKDIVREAIYEKLLAWEPHHNFSSLVAMLTKDQTLLPSEKLESMVNEALSKVDLALLSISNPLSQAINMVSCSDKMSLSTTILTIASFLKALTETPVFKESSISLLKNMCIEYTIDFQFLIPSKEDEILANSNHWTNAADSHLLQMNNADIADFFNGTAPNNQIEAYSKVVSGKGAFSAKQYYVSRSLVRALTPVFDSMSLSDFDNLEIAYTKLSNHPLKLAILLSSAKKFVGISSKLDRIRNYVFAEILGLRTITQICETGIVWLSLANSFVEVDAPYEVIPTHKLGMLINHLSSWLECDIAFDPSFIALRTLLASFLSHLISITGAATPDKTWTLAVDLCLNNLGMAQLDYDTTALEYFSLKLFLTLSRSVDTTVFTDWKQSRISIEEEILSLALFKSKRLQPRSFNKPIELVYDLFERALSKATISKEVLSESSENLYLMLANTRIVGSQKIASFLLKKFIYENQQDAILEVQMRRSNLSGEETSVGELTALNKQLLHAISDKTFHVDSALEHNDHSGLFKYLWSWILVFDHVKESTYSMKAEYINQLKACDAISFLLDTIFETLPLTEQAFLNQLVVEPVEKTEKAKPSQSLIQDYDIKQGLLGKSVKEEVYFLLAHLCYRTFQFLGSFASQWFDEIRDVQLKLQVEKFAKRFVSPILISKMLQEVDDSKDQLIKNDSTLTIKVNRIAYEIKSIYVIDEQTMEMVIKVPEKFPLANVTVEGPTRLGVKENQWKAWLLASQRVISLTNGSLFDSIELFNKNVNLHFSGFEECAICYSILHQDHSLPSKNCPTCSNKFHAACLYKWFKSSGSSTCPLCRSAFNFNTGKP